MEHLLDILNSVCRKLIANDVPEEVMDMLIDSGATLADLRNIGFTEDDIADYIYWVAQVENIPEDVVRERLQKS